MLEKFGEILCDGMKSGNALTLRFAPFLPSVSPTFHLNYSLGVSTSRRRIRHEECL